MASSPNFCSSIDTPLGKVAIYASEHGIKQIGFGVNEHILGQPNSSEITDQTAEQMQQYFDGSRKTFDIPFDFTGHSDFFKKVWTFLTSIPYGETISYGEIAKILGSPNASRAVGMANAKNPFPVIIPCHRVVGGKGKLTGYAFGIKMKQWLLNHEICNREPVSGLLF